MGGVANVMMIIVDCDIGPRLGLGGEGGSYSDGNCGMVVGEVGVGDSCDDNNGILVSGVMVSGQRFQCRRHNCPPQNK